jgi:L-lactate dehydrogenase (cytochrome)
VASTDDSPSARRWRELLSREGTGWPVSIEEWERAASAKLAAGPRGYILGGAGAGATRDANVDAFAQWRLVPRVMATPKERDLSVSLFGLEYSSPIFLSPLGVLTIAHEEGDLAVAAAARDLDMTMIISTAGSVPLETVIERTPGLSSWFQLYWVNNRDLTASLVSRAEAAGCTVLVVTVDTPMLGWRETDLANAYSPFAEGHGIGHFITDPVFRSLIDFKPEDDMGRAGEEMMKLFANPGLGWEDLKWLRSLTDLPILLKGVLHPEDAVRALDLGMNGIVVSNHGGRQVDGCIAALDALVSIRSALPAGAPVLLDGGIRRGADVVKAMALGASAVLVGRPYVYGLAVGGEPGVREVLSNLLAETDSVVALTGQRNISELDSGMLAPPA